MANELPMETTKEKWNKDEKIKRWLTSRQEEGKEDIESEEGKKVEEEEEEEEGEKSEIWKEAVTIWLGTVEHRIWMNNLNYVALPKVPEKAIQYIINSQPTETWNWRLNEVISEDEEITSPFASEITSSSEISEAKGELYVNWWCYMRKFVDDHPSLLQSAVDGLPPNDILRENEDLKLKETQFIYPTLNKWSIFFKTVGFKTVGLSITAVQDIVLAKFAEWLLKLAADRQMFGSEKYNPEIPRIVISVDGKKELILGDQILEETQDLNIQDRDASVTYIMQEGSKILSERGFGTGVWEDINKKYTWLLSGK